MGTKTAITNEEFERMAPQLGPCELVDGEIITMAPAGGDHAEIEVKIAAILYNFVSGRKLGRVLGGEAGMHVRKGTSRGADIAFISYARLPQRTKSFLRVPPELVVEVKSDDVAWAELELKVRDYHQFGVDMVWVADASSRTVRVYPNGKESEITAADAELDGGKILPGFRVRISEFFPDE